MKGALRHSGTPVFRFSTILQTVRTIRAPAGTIVQAPCRWHELPPAFREDTLHAHVVPHGPHLAAPCCGGHLRVRTGVPGGTAELQSGAQRPADSGRPRCGGGPRRRRSGELSRSLRWPYRLPEAQSPFVVVYGADNEVLASSGLLGLSEPVPPLRACSIPRGRTAKIAPPGSPHRSCDSPPSASPLRTAEWCLLRARCPRSSTGSPTSDDSLPSPGSRRWSAHSSPRPSSSCCVGSFRCADVGQAHVDADRRHPWRCARHHAGPTRGMRERLPDRLAHRLGGGSSSRLCARCSRWARRPRRSASSCSSGLSAGHWVVPSAFVVLAMTLGGYGDHHDRRRDHPKTRRGVWRRPVVALPARALQQLPPDTAAAARPRPSSRSTTSAPRATRRRPVSAPA